MEEATQVIVAIKKELQLKKWSEEIKSCAESGMKVKDWCEINGLKTKT
jgi:ABC-type lipoprotein release transport system permease subunit